MLTGILNIGTELKHFIQRSNGLVFKFRKIDGHYVHTYCEGDLLKKFGRSPEQVINKTIFELLPYEDAKEKVKIYDRAWHGENINYEGCFEDLYYFAVLIPILKDNKVLEVWATAFDITWNKQNENMVQKAERLAMVGQLAAGIAHEIRNPLTSLKGFTQILKEKIEEKEHQDYLEIMLGELNRIQQIVNEFMLLSKPNESLNIEETDMQMLIEDVINILRPEISLHNLKIITNIPKNLTAECDINQMKQVLINLLQNAIDASKVKKNNIIVSLEDTNRDFFEITIKDFGQGISKERQKKLFEPFYTTKEKGTGLGLMVCKRIIELHHGSIHISSKEKMGTKVKIILPN